MYFQFAFNQNFSQNPLDAIFWIPEILVEKKQKNKDAKLRETDKQRNKRKPKGQKGKNVINKVGKGYV